MWSKSLGFKKVYVLNDKQDLRLRRRLHVPDGGEEARHPGRRLQGLGRQAVELRGACERDQGLGRSGGLPGRIVCNNGAKLMQDIKAVDPKISSRCRTGSAAVCFEWGSRERRVHQRGGQPPTSLTGPGKDFVKSFGKQVGATPNPYSAYGAQAMLVMLQAVARGAGDRAKTTKAISA